MEENKNSMQQDDMPESNAARRLRLTGENSTDVSYDSAAPMKKAGFFENFWYHHKWAFIITVSFALFLAVGITQILTRNNAELHIMYAGPVSFDKDSMNSALEALTSIPFEDGYPDSSDIELIRFIYYSTEKQEQLKAEASEAEQTYIFDAKFNNDEYSGFRDEIVAGSSVICILDKSLYNDASAQGAFISLEEIYSGNVPKEISDIAFDSCSIRFSETKFAEFYTVFSHFPEDTVIALRQNSVMGGSKRLSEEDYKKQIEYFKSLLAFEYPEGYNK